MFDVQCAEQDDGVLECNRRARRLQETQGNVTSVSYYINVVMILTDRPHPGACTMVMRNNELVALPNFLLGMYFQN